MAKQKTKKKGTGRKATGEPSKADSADGVRVGDEPVPGMKLRCICRGHQGTIGRIAWSPCGRFIASPSEDKTIRIWDANDGKCHAVLTGHDAEVRTVVWSQDGQELFSGSQDTTIRIWKRESAVEVGVLGKHDSDVNPLAWSNRFGFLASAGWENKVKIWNPGAGELVETIDLTDHTAPITSLAWSPDGGILAIGDNGNGIGFWRPTGQEPKLHVIDSENGGTHSLAWSPDGKYLAAGTFQSRVQIWRADGSRVIELEGHTRYLASVSFSCDGRVLASKATDNTVRLWRTEAWDCLRTIEESCHDWESGMSFHRDAPILATVGGNAKQLHIWDVDTRVLLGSSPLEDFVAYTSAKIVLVGQSNVGKSCLAMRLAEGRYPEDHEQGTTHGMRFWPMEAEDLHSAAKPPGGQRRDVVLWDFGGQDEYQLVHQMFLHDTTLALVLIDPTRGRAAMDEARDWNKRLEKHLGKDRVVKLLVGAKVDKKRDLIDQNSIDNLCEECGFAGFLDLSAKTGRNTKRLRKLISDALDWDQMAKTSRPELFQHIRDDVEARRKKKQIVLTLDAFKKAIKKSAAKLYEEAAVDAVTDQLATQGIIVRTKLTGGDEAIVLQLPVIERYAGSLIIAARNNPRGVPVLEERLLGSTQNIPLPGMVKKERLSPAKERMVLECIVELMIQHGICFRHGGLLVFPTLFPAGGTDDEKLPHSVSLYYDFTGAIDNIYASLVSKLMVSEEFGEGRLRADRVEFERGRQGVCGVRQAKYGGGFAHLDLFFSEETKADRKDLFTRFVEEHLRTHGVDIHEYQAITCRCGEAISERIVQTRISAGGIDVICPICETKTQIGEGVDRIRERSPETEEKMVALRKTIDVKLAEDIKSAKKAVAGAIRVAKTDDPIQILHLSDLHFADKTNPVTKLQLLLQDIRQEDEDYAATETVEYLVISGDMTDKGNDAGFEKARQFVEALVKELGLSTHRCIFVPGNHDVQDRADAYEEREAEDGSAIKVRHPDNFPKRFLRFSDGFFHPLLQTDYPLSYVDQGISYLFPDTGIQFLTLNSAWEIDKNGRKKAGIHPDAVAGVIAKAEEERKRAVERDDLKSEKQLLRIGVWHHAVAGPELMDDLGFLTQLQKAGMQICLHGDVHEQRTELFGYGQPGIEVRILGAGSFGSAAEGRPESTPRLYNMLEVSVDPRTKKHLSIRVHTRKQKKAEEAWQGYHEWPNPEGKGRLPYYDIDLL